MRQVVAAYDIHVSLIHSKSHHQIVLIASKFHCQRRDEEIFQEKCRILISFAKSQQKFRKSMCEENMKLNEGKVGCENVNKI